MTKLAPTAKGAARRPYQAVGPASLAELSPQEQGRILPLLDHESQITEITTILTKTREGMLAAADAQDIPQLVQHKNQANAIQKIARNLHQRALQQEGMELTRRAERQIGLAILAGQERGEIVTRGQTSGQFLRDLVGRNAMNGDQGNNGIWALTKDLSDEDFEEVITQAREEGRLSRTHVAELCRRKRGAPEPQPTSTESTELHANDVMRIADAMPKHLRMLILLSAWCGLKFGELQELRRRDITPDVDMIHVRRSVLSRTSFVVVDLQPGTRMAPRDVRIPQELRGALRDHMKHHVDPDQDALLFTARQGGHIAISTVQSSYYKAREVVDRPNLRFDDLKYAEGLIGTPVPNQLQDAPPTRRVRKTAAARNVMVDLLVTLNGLAWACNDTDPREVDLDNHRDEIAEMQKSLGVISRFLNKVKEQ